MIKIDAKRIALVALPTLAIAGATYAATPQTPQTTTPPKSGVTAEVQDANEPAGQEVKESSASDTDNVQSGDQTGDHQD